ncbi:MAG: hypothetical protein ACPGQS_04170 [Bradymonadia bacterium]
MIPPLDKDDSPLSTVGGLESSNASGGSDLLGIVVCGDGTICVWWSVGISSLTEIDPSVRLNAVSLNVYSEGRDGVKKRESFKVDRLNGHVRVSKLPAGGRVNAAMGVQTDTGFTHIIGSAPVRLPSKASGKAIPGKGLWVGSEQFGQKHKPKSTALGEIGLDGRVLSHVEHLPWERT